ncbi:unnamed protein product [Rotaria socialis]|uniref:Uncharacterized protein n=2 Tax=Rotaria socialis TaxID=392032 RepID=A0A818N3X4_9BILA|nr:unnamed protein product [Rotaria socialis]CAF3496868.1 unnamed protein product [Rotaria socialis]CAF3599321.1 unnamed protein product [Rotaria socialis]CAF3702056.1 unnamed protein product [Rotaria socialis]CAF4363901.1 unnamed protein product [Rotaria socialis]
MGSTPSTSQVKKHNPIHPLPTQDPLRQHRRHSQSSSPPPRTAHKRAKVDDLQWPLPPSESGGEFRPDWPTDRERYSIKKAYSLKATNKVKKATVIDESRTNSKQFHQKETSINASEKRNSSIHDSAQVQSSLQTQSHACINLSTTQEIDDLLNRLSQVHQQIDLNVEEQGKLISEQSKLLIDLIINDTRNAQQQLLSYAKMRQTGQDKLYNDWLQMYVVALDQWKSMQLAELQDDLQAHQSTIMQRSQYLISQVNQDSHTLREQLLKVQQENASKEIQEIIGRIESMSTHHLGTETMTRINLVIHGNVGTKMPGQDCKFDFDQSNPESDRVGVPKTKPSGVGPTKHKTTDS